MESNTSVYLQTKGISSKEMSKTFFCFVTLRADRPLACFGIICLYKSAKTTKRIHLDNRVLFDKKIFEKCVGYKRSHGFHATRS